MRFGTNDRHMLGSLGSVWAFDEGNEILALSLIHVEGPPPSKETMQALSKNIASILNGVSAAQGISEPGLRQKWKRDEKTGEIQIQFQRGQALNTSTTVRVYHNPRCPEDITDMIYERLAEHGGMGALLKTIAMQPAPVIGPSVRSLSPGR